MRHCLFCLARSMPNGLSLCRVYAGRLNEAAHYYEPSWIWLINPEYDSESVSKLMLLWRFVV